MKSSLILRIAFFVLAIAATASCAFDDATRKQSSYHYQMGLSHLAEKNVTKALIEFAEAEKLTPDDPEVLNQLGLAYYYKKRFDLAEEKYLKALKLKPEYPEARNNLGVVYLETKRWDEAIIQLKRVTDDIFYQDQENAQMNLGLAYLGKEDFSRALAVFNSLVSSNPRSPVVRVHLGRVYFAMGKTEQAIAEYQNALQLYPEYAGAFYHLGVAYTRTRDYEAARAAFGEVVRIAPYTELSQMALDRMNALK